MIKKTRAVVLTPTHLRDAENKFKKWLEVFPQTPKEVAYYAKLDHRRTTHGETEPHETQSPLLIELSYARELGLV